MPTEDYTAQLSELLQRKHGMATGAIEKARNGALQGGLSLDRLILKAGLLDEHTLLNCVAELLDLDVVDTIDHFGLDREAYEALGARFFREREAIPLRDPAHSPSLIVVTANPSARALREELMFYLAEPFTLRAATTAEITKATDAIDRGTVDYRANVETDEQPHEFLEENDGTTVRSVNKLFLSAAEAKASDIHLETTQTGVVVRFRVHGILHEHEPRLEADLNSVMTRIKVLARFNLSESQQKFRENYTGKIVASCKKTTKIQKAHKQAQKVSMSFKSRVTNNVSFSFKNRIQKFAILVK